MLSLNRQIQKEESTKGSGHQALPFSLQRIKGSRKVSNSSERLTSRGNEVQRKWLKTLE
jgi:hypothetical protein